MYGGSLALNKVKVGCLVGYILDITRSNLNTNSNRDDDDE
jgi:hypothetical protein